MFKNPFLQVDRNEYWMGMAYMFASRSPSFNAALIVDMEGELVNYCCEKKILENNIEITCDIAAIVNCSKPLQCASLYMTTTPTEVTAKVVLAKHGLRRIVYYPKKEISDQTKALLDGVYAELVPYAGSFGWIRDCVRALDYFSAPT